MTRRKVVKRESQEERNLSKEGRYLRRNSKKVVNKEKQKGRKVVKNERQDNNKVVKKQRQLGSNESKQIANKSNFLVIIVKNQYHGILPNQSGCFFHLPANVKVWMLLAPVTCQSSSYTPILSGTTLKFKQTFLSRLFHPVCINRKQFMKAH